MAQKNRLGAVLNGIPLSVRKRLSRGRLRKANAARDAKQYAEAAEGYEGYLEIWPDHGPIHVQAGHMHKEAGQYRRAERHYLKARALMPNDADLNFQIGHFYKLVNRICDAMGFYGQAAILAPDWQAPRNELRRLRDKARLMFHSGALFNEHSLLPLEDEGDKVAGGAAASLLTAFDGVIFGWRKRLYRQHRRQADAARDAGQHAVAAVDYATYLRGRPDDGAIHVQAGHMYKEAHQYRQAERHYLLALALLPDDADLNFQLGHFYKITERLYNAMGAYNHAARLSPEWKSPQQELDLLRERIRPLPHSGGFPLGHAGLARPAAKAEGGLVYGKTIGLSAPFCGFLGLFRKGLNRKRRQRADASRAAGRYAEAAADYAAYLVDQPNNGPIHVQAGHMYKEAGHYRQAEQHYLLARVLMPDDADLCFQLGHFYKLTDRLFDAMGAYAQAVILAPNWQEPRRELAQLRDRMRIAIS